ncbi:MAG: hypothetical protein JNL68_16865 [Burkholderiales bacterium]|nr:hypothetical protein [Burkholderiales bacterium]
MDTRVVSTSDEAQDHFEGVPAASEHDALERRLEAFARQPEVGELDALISAWACYADATRVSDRFGLYARLALRVRRGELPAWALVPILLGDNDRTLVSAAATTVALSHRPDANGPETGPFCVLDHLLTPRARNPGAGLGALLGLGDAEVAAVIFDLRRMLAHPELSTTLEEMIESSTGVLHRSTVEFFLRWLEDLARDLPGAADMFRRVARGLANRRAASAADFVIEGRPRYPAPLEGQMHEHGWCLIPLPEYTRSIASRLNALQRAAAGLPAVPDIAGPWGLASDREEAEFPNG